MNAANLLAGSEALAILLLHSSLWDLQQVVCHCGLIGPGISITAPMTLLLVSLRPLLTASSPPCLYSCCGGALRLAAPREAEEIPLNPTLPPVLQPDAPLARHGGTCKAGGQEENSTVPPPQWVQEELVATRLCGLVCYLPISGGISAPRVLIRHDSSVPWT